MSSLQPVQRSRTIRIMWGFFIAVDTGLLLYWGLYGLDWLPAFAVLLPEAPGGGPLQPLRD